MSILIRMELAHPGSQILMGNNQLCNILVAGHTFFKIFKWLCTSILIEGFVVAIAYDFNRTTTNFEKEQRRHRIGKMF